MIILAAMLVLVALTFVPEKLFLDDISDPTVENETENIPIRHI